MKLSTYCDKVTAICEDPNSTPDQLVKALDGLIKKLQSIKMPAHTINDNMCHAVESPPEETR